MLLPSYICLSPATVSHTLYLPAGCGISPCLNHGQTECFGSVWSSCGQSGYVTAVRYTTWCSASLSNTHTLTGFLSTHRQWNSKTYFALYLCMLLSLTLVHFTYSSFLLSNNQHFASRLLTFYYINWPPPSPCYCLVLDWDVNLMTRLRSLTMCCVWQAQTEANLHVACHW